MSAKKIDMRNVITGLLLIAVSISGCRKSDFANNIPNCIKNNIEANKSNPSWNCKEVDEYNYQGQLVYIFEAEEIYPDAATGVLRSDCTTLCGLGGIAGIMICNGDKFYNKAIFIRTVWHK